MGKVLQFRLTERHIRRQAEKEMKKLYKLTAGGSTPLTDPASHEMFGMGFIDEARWIDLADWEF